jgi:chemotaxis signal transduction protein
MPWAIVSLKNQPYAISAVEIQEMLIAPEVARVPQTADWVRGVLNLRGQILPLIDLRKRLGLVSAVEEIEEFCDLMRQREQDHRNWLAELEASVREQRAFTLTTDPHQCKFGQWYDKYEAPNLVVAELLKRFDAPHQAIHRVAIDVADLVTQGNTSGAESLIANARAGVLNTMISLFTDLRNLIQDSQREIAVVLSGQAGKCAVCVDSVDAVEALASDSITELPRGEMSAEGSLARRVGTRPRSGQLVLLLEVQTLLRDVAHLRC